MNLPQVITQVIVHDGVAIVLGQPGAYEWLAEDHEAQHSCDQMHCSSVGPHVLARIPITPLEGSSPNKPDGYIGVVEDRPEFEDVCDEHGNAARFEVYRSGQSALKRFAHVRAVRLVLGEALAQPRTRGRL